MCLPGFGECCKQSCSRGGTFLAADVTQLIIAREKQVQDYDQHSGDVISDAVKLGVVLHRLPDPCVREHLLLKRTR